MNMHNKFRRALSVLSAIESNIPKKASKAEVSIKMNLPPAVVPTPSIFDKIVPRRQGQQIRISHLRRKFEQIVAEVDFLYTISTEVPSSLSEAQWLQLLDTVSAPEREHLLRTIHYAQLVEKKTTTTTTGKQHQHQKGTTMGEECQNEDDDGENGWGKQSAADGAPHSVNPSGHLQHQLFGAEFCEETALKRRIDTRFGLALCQNAVLEATDGMPKLVVDCRFMYAHKFAHILSAAKRVNQLHVTNWTSAAPFPISIVNFFVDHLLDRIVKNQWHFLYGTPREQAQFEGCHHHFVPHPFAPHVTTRGVSETCARDGIEKTQIAYVSQRAIDYLPDNLGQFRAFVLLPFDDWEQKWLLPTKAALTEQLPCYRLPLDKHICDVSRNIPCWLVANILREVYIRRMDWATVARRWGRELTSFEYRPNSDQINPEHLPFSPEMYMEKKKLRAQTLEKLEQYTEMLTKQKSSNIVDPTTSVQNEQHQQNNHHGFRHAGRAGLTSALVGGKKNRRYSREERNRRRLEEEAMKQKGTNFGCE